MKSSFEIGEILFTICAGTYEEAEEAFTWLYHNSWEEIWGVLNARATLCGLSIEDKKSKIGINTHLTNKIVFDALKKRLIKNFSNLKEIKQEVKFGENTRFDFLVTNENKKTFIEVKNVTLSRKKGLAEFPDAVTSRGLKHINELLKANKKGFEIYLFYVIQRDDCMKFDLAKDIDPDYCELLLKAVKKNLNILCYDCKFSTKGIKLNRKIKLNFNE